MKVLLTAVVLAGASVLTGCVVAPLEPVGVYAAPPASVTIYSRPGYRYYDRGYHGGDRRWR